MIAVHASLEVIRDLQGIVIELQRRDAPLADRIRRAALDTASSTIEATRQGKADADAHRRRALDCCARVRSELDDARKHLSAFDLSALDALLDRLTACLNRM